MAIRVDNDNVIRLDADGSGGHKSGLVGIYDGENEGDVDGIDDVVDHERMEELIIGI